MEELSNKRIEARKKFLLRHGVSEDVIADLDLSDDADEDQIVVYISDWCSTYLQISIDAKGKVLKGGPCTWASVSLPLLETMLEAAGASFNRLEVEFGFFPERFMAESAEDLLDVLVRHAPKVTELMVNVDGDRADYVPWHGFLLDLIGRYPGIVDLFLQDTPFSEETLLTIRQLVPRLESLKLPQVFGNYMDPSWLATTVLGFPHLNRFRIGVEMSWHDWDGAGLSIDTYDNHYLRPWNWDFYGQLFAAFLEQLPRLEYLKIEGSVKFESIKGAMQAHPTLKQFTWCRPQMCTHQMQPEALIRALPNVESIECRKEFPCFHHEGVAQGILAAVKAHGNLKRLVLDDLRMPRDDEVVRRLFRGPYLGWTTKVRKSQWPKLLIDEEAKAAIQHQVYINRYEMGIKRVKALLGDNPTIRQWVVAMCGFCDEPAMLEYLLQTGDGGGPNQWVPHALAAIGHGAAN